MNAVAVNDFAVEAVDHWQTHTYLFLKTIQEVEEWAILVEEEWLLLICCKALIHHFLSDVDYGQM